MKEVYAASSQQCRLLSRHVHYVLLTGAQRLAMPLGDVPTTADQNSLEACQATMPGLVQTMMHCLMQGMAKFAELMIFI